MRTLNKIWGIILLAALLVLANPKVSKAQDGDYISDQEFYDNLQPYGTWVSDPDYGNVWVPNVDDDFRPYATRGHWVLTDYGNTWVSDYPWGWATFHYGRWRYDDYYGWEWIPGHHWAPAWVSWRHGGGYYGWAPLMPGVSISISIGGGYHVPDNYWVCAPQAYINRPNIYNYYVPPSRSVTIIHNTTIINNTNVYNNQTYVAGPRPQEIRQVTHQNVKIYNITNVNRPTNITVNNIHNNTINVYRPAVQTNANAHPARVVDAAAYKQQNPNQAIGNRGRGGAPAFNHSNAAKLAMVAKAPAPDNKVVRINPVNNRPNTAKPNTPPVQPAVTKQPQARNNVPVQQQDQQRRPQQAQQRQQQQQTQQGAQQQKVQQQAQQKTQLQDQQRAQQQAQQKAQQQAQQKTQLQDQQRVQLQAQQKTQQQDQQRVQQQAQQRAQQQAQQKTQQQDQQRVQLQAQQRAQQQTQQKTQQQDQQRVQQRAQQKAQQQAAQQQAQQRAQQQAQQRAQQLAQQQAQQQAQQKAQQQTQQQAQQRAQQQAQQRAQQAQQQKQKQHPQEPPKQR